MIPGLSILIPHKSTPLNDQALELMLRMIRENTQEADREVIVVENHGDPYRFWNRYAEAAKHDALLFTCSDMPPAFGWDVLMKRHLDDNSIVTGHLVEPGVIGVAQENIQVDFGRTPGAFRREEFQRYVERRQDIPEVRDGRGWYMPVLWTKALFLGMGKYPQERPFPAPNDIDFFNRCVERGAQLKQVRSFAYHFQNLSNPEHDFKR